MGNPSFSGSMLVFGGEWCVFTICCLSFAIFSICCVFLYCVLFVVVRVRGLDSSYPLLFQEVLLGGTPIRSPNHQFTMCCYCCYCCVWYIYLHLVDLICIYICIFMVNVGKYTSPMDPSWVVVTVVNGKDGRFFRGDFARWRPWEFHAVWMWQLVVDIPWPSLRGAVPWMVWRFLFLCKVFKLKKTMVPVYSPGKLPYKKSNQNVGKPCCRCCHHL